MAKVPARLTKDPALDALAAWPFPDSVDYFMSGSNQPGEIAALAELGRNVGVAVPELYEPSLEQIAKHFGFGVIRLFVDSGAYSEVDLSENKPPTWPRPITDAEWHRRMRMYVSLAQIVRQRGYFVAPDRVADQEVTVQRLRAYGAYIGYVAAYGCQVLVPVQRGRLPMAKLYELEREILLGYGVPPWQMYPAVPLRRAATPLPDLAVFARSLVCEERAWRDPATGRTHHERPRLHMLGRGVYSPEYRDTIAAVLDACPDVQITSDSVHIRSQAFLGSRETPGPYWLAKELVRQSGVRDTFSVQRLGMHMALRAEDERALLEAVRAGWYDSELFSSAAEELAWLAAGRPEVWPKPR